LLAVVGVALVAGALAFYQLLPERGLPQGAPTLDEMATEIGAPIMGLLQRGHVPGRSGEVLLVPKPHNFIIGEWDLTTLGTSTPDVRTSHPNPWDYIVRIPLVLYGPPFVESGRAVTKGVDIADLAPSYAALMGMQALDSDGEPLTEAIADAPDRIPRVIFTIVLDGGGWNALQEHPSAWPTIQELRQGGTDYVNATIGSAPSITGALHATFGTGFYPNTHGIPGNQMRGPDGKNTDAWRENADPSYLLEPTVSELWDEQTGNEAIVATVSYEGWHLGMIGHGAQRDGGDRDIAVLWEAGESEEGVEGVEGEWWINEDFYELPDYLQETDIDRLERYEVDLDARDGMEDDLWFGHDLEELRDPVVRPGSSAFVRFTADAVVDVLNNEPFGNDEITDLFWVEMKMPDFAGHRWNMLGPEEADVIKATDEQIARFKAELDRLVGPGNYVLALSADHGQEPLPDVEGGWRINSQELLRDIEERFGDVVEKITTVDIFFDQEAVRSRDVDLEDVARYMGTYTIGDNIPNGAVGADNVPEARLDDELFAGAFPTDYFQSLTPDRISSFGAGDYPEGDLSGPVGAAR
jgi:hypothetical protein